MSWTIQKLLQWTESYFKKHDIKSPRVDAEVLISHVLKKKRIDLYVQFESLVSDQDLAQLKLFIQRRVQHEPIQYIVGNQEFWSLPIQVGPGVLIARGEKECLVEKATFFFKEKKETPFNILDVGTGSGALSLALAKEFPLARIVAIDLSEKALQIARQNRDTLGFSERITFRQSDLFENIDEKFDLVISNPPYISEKMWEGLAPEIKLFEPKEALLGGEDGTDIHQRILKELPTILSPGGYLIMEISPEQVSPLNDYLTKQGFFRNIAISKDYSGYERVLSLQV